MSNRDPNPRIDALTEDALEALFTEARRAPDRDLKVSNDVMARVLADAVALQPQPKPLPQSPSPHHPRPEPATVAVWQGLRGSFGGWLGLGGVALAGVAGLMIGITSPEMVETGLPSLTTNVESELMFDPLDGFDVSLLLEESGI